MSYVYHLALKSFQGHESGPCRQYPKRSWRGCRERSLDYGAGLSLIPEARIGVIVLANSGCDPAPLIHRMNR